MICAGADDATLSSEDVFGAKLLDALPQVTPVGPVATIGGSPAIRVADGPQDTLCLTIGDRPFSALGCAVVSPNFDTNLPGAVDRLRDPTQVALAVPHNVAAIRLSSADRSVARTIPTVAGEAYTGRYAGLVRFIVAQANQRALTRVELVDAAGAVLHEEESSADVPFELANPRVLAARRLAGRTGGPSLWQTTVRAAGDTRRCLGLTTGPRPSADEPCRVTRSERAVLLNASCVTRRLTVAVVAAPGTRVRADVGAASTRRVRLRNGVGLLTLPASRPLQALTVIRNGRSRRVQIRAPAAGRQCGWEVIRRIEPGDLR